MDQERVRRLLDRERRRIERALAELRQPSGTDELTSQDQHLADQASNLQERELEEGLAEQLEDELAALERAEARLAAGTYGLSIESGEPIPDERLEANPLAERTVTEERRFERG
jgi:DnaK suppressor protein